MACADSHVHGNWVKGATDGGIVLFGSPGTVVENNTVWVGDNTQLGGIVSHYVLFVTLMVRVN